MPLFSPAHQCRHSFPAISLPSCRWQQWPVPSLSVVTGIRRLELSDCRHTASDNRPQRPEPRGKNTLHSFKKKEKSLTWKRLIVFSSSKFKRVTNPEINLRLQVTFYALSLSTKMGTTLFVVAEAANFSLVLQQHAAKRSGSWLVLSISVENGELGINWWSANKLCSAKVL